MPLGHAIVGTPRVIHTSLPSARIDSNRFPVMTAFAKHDAALYITNWNVVRFKLTGGRALHRSRPLLPDAPSPQPSPRITLSAAGQRKQRTAAAQSTSAPRLGRREQSAPEPADDEAPGAKPQGLRQARRLFDPRATNHRICHQSPVTAFDTNHQSPSLVTAFLLGIQA